MNLRTNKVHDKKLLRSRKKHNESPEGNESHPLIFSGFKQIFST